MRNVQRLGMKKQYERVNIDRNGIRTYSPIRIWIRRIMGLAFIPTDQVVDAFATLLDQIPEDLAIDPFLSYFQSTWVSGVVTARRTGRARFPPACWNIRGRTLLLMNRTNNHIGAFHNSFKRVVGHSNPTIWGFQQSITDGMMICVLGGTLETLRRTTEYLPLRPSLTAFL